MALGITTFYNVINNELTSTENTRHGTNPANRQPNPPVPVSTVKDLDNAVHAAHAAFKIWSRTSKEVRRTALNAFADLIEENKDPLASLPTREQGKPIAQSQMETSMALQWTRTLTTLDLPETVVEETDERKVIQRYVPLGVVSAIVPWNYPLLLAVGKIVPSIYTGNAVIVKPSPFTPYCDLKLAELGMRCFPPGLLQALSGGDDLGPMMTEHPRFDKSSFTGSSVTGRRVMASCAKTLKRVTLELGGNDPAILCDDIDIDAQVQFALQRV